jgi:glucose/mannose-6-phosphate isomerase
MDRAHDRTSVNLDDVAALERGDPYGVRHVLAEFAAQCRVARGLRPEPRPQATTPRLVTVAAMGGSAASGDLLAACAAETLDVPVLVHRGYGLPPSARPDTLVIATSYSGDTAETISAAQAAIERRTPLVVVTAGGELARLAATRGVPQVTLPSGLMPRMALGYLFFPQVEILRAVELGVATETEVEESLDVVEALGKELGPERPVDLNPAKQLAQAIGGGLAVIYGGPTTAVSAYRWKTDIEENAKVLATAGVLPEMNHNEIEAWSAPGARRLHAVFLRDAGEPREIERRFAILRELIGDDAGGLSEMWARGRGRVSRLLSLAVLGQWVSYYLALLRRVDPWTVPRLDEFKRRMAAPGRDCH